MDKEELFRMEKKVMEKVGYPSISKEMIEDFKNIGWLSIKEGRDGNHYLWYLDDDCEEACLRIETEEFISQQEIHKLLTYLED